MNSISDQEKLKQPSHIYKTIQVQTIPVSPADTTTPLQIVCFPDVSVNQAMAGGTEAVDNKFNGAIKDLRLKDIFHGDLFETLMLTPAEKIPAKTLLLVGLGNPETLSINDLEKIGKIAVNEAIKLNVTSFSFAPSIRDAGISKFEAQDVTVALASGMLKALDQAKILEDNKLIPSIKLKEIVFLAGAKYLENSQAGLRKVFAK